MHITRNSLPTATAPTDWFAGTVYIDPIAAPAPPFRIQAASVHFTPGARTAWHTHPFGQTIFVTEGSGAASDAGEPSRSSRPAIASSSSLARTTGTARRRTAS